MSTERNQLTGDKVASKIELLQWQEEKKEKLFG